MAQDDNIALLFLAYLVLPIVILLLVWLVSFVRRRVFKKGGETEGGGEGET